jgi:hypothetical protein
MKTIYQLLFFAFLSLVSAGVYAQAGYNVSGVVTNDKGKPLPSATVFIGGSQRVTPTDANGRFNFQNMPAGTFKVSVQMLGYAPLTRNIIVKNAPLTIDMQLQPKAIKLDEVVIGKRNGWKNNFDLFKRNFLGTTRNAKECVILNPEVINFSTGKDLLQADAEDFLIIENRRLGYRIHYLLQEIGYNLASHITLYHGEFSFEEMEGTEDQKQEWAKNRADTYKGSFMHFLRSVYANNTLENGFIAMPIYGYGKYVNSQTNDPYKLIVENRPVKFDSLITAIDSNFVSLKFKQLYVTYDPKKAAAYQRSEKEKTDVIQKTTIVIDRNSSSLTQPTDQAIIDKKGSYTDYRNFFIKGYWAKARMGDELPVEYVSPFAEIPRGNIPVSKPAFALQNWTDSIPQEKTYLHMDKPYYAVGDTMWFNGYGSAGSRHQLSAISGAVYVDLINEQNQQVKTLKLPAELGTIAGNIILNEEIKAGNYRIRAYTQWMRNAGDDYFFDRTFTIGDPRANKETPAKKPAVLPTTDVQFFPESGNLIAGITSRVGFKAVGADGLGVPISGSIVDNDNKPVADLTTRYAGMGNFLLKPLPGKTYTANIKLADGTIKNINLPNAVSMGYVLSVYQPAKDSVLVRIQASEQLQHTTVNLVVHSSGEVVFLSAVALNGPTTSIWLDKQSFPSGIAQFTIFDINNQPLNERIAFIKNTDRMQLAIKADRVSYKSKDHVQLELNANQSGGAPIAANFSVAVIDQNKVPVDESAESTIFSHILLSSDLKGYIEKPNYYFMADTNEVNKALDNLMLTQGYRRFEWQALVNTINTKPILAAEEMAVTPSGSVKAMARQAIPNANALVSTVNTKPVFAAEGKSTTISGTVTTLGHKPLPDALVMLLSMNARINKTMLTDSNGRFKFDNLIFADSAKFAVQARGTVKAADDALIILDSVPQITVNAKPSLADVTIIKTNLQKAEEEGKPAKLTGLHVLKQVDIKAQALKKTNPDVMTQGMFTLPNEGSADKILTIDHPEHYPTLTTYLHSALSGVIFKKDFKGRTVLESSRPKTTFASTGPQDPSAPPPPSEGTIQVILNGGASSFEDIDDIPVEDIVKILVVKNNQAMINFLRRSDEFPGGYLLIQTRTPAARKRYEPGIVNISPKGFNKVRQFYSPRYDGPRDATTAPDLRTTIYWAPYVNTDENGKAKIDFYNADSPGTYRVVVEGINAAGELGRQVFTYTVE